MLILGHLCLYWAVYTGPSMLILGPLNWALYAYVVILNSVIMPSVIMLSVIMLSVVYAYTGPLNSVILL